MEGNIIGNETNLVAMSKFFGRRPGQSLKEFKEEVDQLSIDEQQHLGDLIRSTVMAKAN